MTVLVAYASKHGATEQIAERIAATLTDAGRPAVVRPVEIVDDITQYDAFVIGAAAYYGHWLGPAVDFVTAHSESLSAAPVWLFSSGPLGTEATDSEGHDLRKITMPKEMLEAQTTVDARGRRVFFGALDPHDLTVTQRTLRHLPGGKKLLAEGDFRDWDEIDAWAREIADELTPRR